MKEEDLEKFYEEKQSLMDLKLSQEKNKTRQHNILNLRRQSQTEPSNSKNPVSSSDKVITYSQYQQEKMNYTARNQTKFNPLFSSRNSTTSNNNEKTKKNQNGFFRKNNSAKNIFRKKNEISPNYKKKNSKKSSTIASSNQTIETGDIKQYDNDNWHYKPLSNRIISLQPSLPHSTKGKDNCSVISSINQESNLNLNRSTQSLINESSYKTNDIKQLYTNRKHLLNTIYIKKKTKDESFKEFYDNNISFVSQKNEKNEKLLKEKIDNELKQCTFKPTLSESTKKMINKSIEYNVNDKQKDGNYFYDKNIKWKKKRDQQLQKEITLSQKKKFEECYFHPISNIQQYEEVINNLKGKDNDYIYRKNLEWLATKKMNQKKGEMEQIEERKKEKEKFKKANSFLVKLGKAQNNLTPKENLELNLAKPKFYNTKRSHSVRTKQNYRSQWLEKKLDDDRYYVPYDKISQQKCGGDNINNINVKKEINDIKMMIASLKNVLTVNKVIVKDLDKNLKSSK